MGAAPPFPPAEAEANYHAAKENLDMVAGLKPNRLRKTRDASLMATARAQVAGLNKWAKAQLGEAPWFNGASFGWGDIAVVPFVLGAAGFGSPPAPDSKLAAWLARCRARPSVAETAMEAEAVAPLVAKMVPQMLASGAFKRKYRDHGLEWMLRSAGMQVVLDGLADGTIRFSSEIGT